MIELRDRMRAWNVYLGDRLVNTVYYDWDMSAETVKRSLVDHYNFPSNIVVLWRD